MPANPPAKNPKTSGLLRDTLICGFVGILSAIVLDRCEFVINKALRIGGTDIGFGGAMLFFMLAPFIFIPTVFGVCAWLLKKLKVNRPLDIAAFGSITLVMTVLFLLPTQDIYRSMIEIAILVIVSALIFALYALVLGAPRNTKHNLNNLTWIFVSLIILIVGVRWIGSTFFPNYWIFKVWL